ncbi:MAG: hypothetical protein S0880_31550 [Actinomycetota bacterium]|nr:hypothetical protein [Actinomycetota bacterium]
MQRYPMPDDHLVVSGVRAMLDGRILDDATIVCDQGRIAAIEEGVHRSGAVDGRGAFCVAAPVSLQARGLDAELRGDGAGGGTRAPLPPDFALRSLEGRLAAAGVGTAFHLVSFAPAVDAAPGVAADDLCAEIARRRTQAPPVDHRVVHGIDAGADEAWAAARPHLERFDDLVDGSPLVPPLVSLDLTGRGGTVTAPVRVPVVTGVRAEDDEAADDGSTADGAAAAELSDADHRDDELEAHLRALGAAAVGGDVTLVVRGADESGVELASGLGAVAVVSPPDVDTAVAADGLGLAVVADALDVLPAPGRSSATTIELVSRGCCRALVSGGTPAALLAAAFELARVGVATLPETIGLVTRGPAGIAGLHDRGRVAVGCRADLVLVRPDGRWPRVVDVLRPPGDLDPMR